MGWEKQQHSQQRIRWQQPFVQWLPHVRLVAPSSLHFLYSGNLIYRYLTHPSQLLDDSYSNTLNTELTLSNHRVLSSSPIPSLLLNPTTSEPLRLHLGKTIRCLWQRMPVFLQYSSFVLRIIEAHVLSGYIAAHIKGYISLLSLQQSVGLWLSSGLLDGTWKWHVQFLGCFLKKKECAILLTRMWT